LLLVAAFAKSRAKTLGSLKATRMQDLENPAHKEVFKKKLNQK